MIPKRRSTIENALGRVVELGGEALLITADGSGRAARPGVRHLDLLRREMHWGPNRLIAASPKRLAARLVGKKVGGRSLAWRRWVASKPYKVVRFHILSRVLAPLNGELRPSEVTHIVIAGVESWPIAWHITRFNPEAQIVWDVPGEWRTPQ
ncbi:hypothetical protein N864_06390 [Intrasporangium chromatireducens Q5-1]|uniref:Uncharacterized protein n=1 Tax=Intrasporangium chromatireducens Q5-1 TaxID=584657 RepID=W9GRA5_9MICO|nr:hypothetical protein [Intrasporangium chromatireducens]EWT07567.1 hypothetical protein N864_06390 [Intrasporangium chromatireducens Q5-1]